MRSVIHLSLLIDTIRKGVLFAFIFLLFRQFFVLGLIVPLRIESGSMVPMFYGPRYGVVCEECRHAFYCGADGPVERSFLACPECGFAENPIRSARRLPGERIVIDRLTPGFKRFDAIVFRNPESPTQWNVKRIVAFPGETVAFRDGNLWINGELYRKTLKEQRKTAIPYPFGRWNTDEHQISFDPSEPIPHFAPLPEPSFPGPQVPALNSALASTLTPVNKFFSTRNPYNQLHRERREDTRVPTDEILLTFPKEFLNGEIAISTKYETMILKKTDTKILTILRNEEIFAVAPIPSRTRVEISVIDRTFQLGDGNAMLLMAPLPNDTEPKTVLEKSPIVFRSDSINTSEIEIRVDPYFSDSQGDWVVPEKHYFVLGDNATISEDSRHWAKPFVPKSMILGVARKFFPQELPESSF